MQLNTYESLMKLKINCASCCGLCCTALYFAKSEGFPQDKPAGLPCCHLSADYRCDIHDQLFSRKMKGCMAYDCFGAGQWVTQHLFKGKSWHQENKELMFTVFIKTVQLHQMLWYLYEASIRIQDVKLVNQINEQACTIEKQLNEAAEVLAACNIDEIRRHVNQYLKQVCAMISITFCGRHIKGNDAVGRAFKKADLSGHDYSMCYLIAADLRACKLDHTNFLGADLRDADVRNTDLSSSCFLTQGQINSAKGNRHTKLPAYLEIPSAWLKAE